MSRIADDFDCRSYGRYIPAQHGGGGSSGGHRDNGTILGPDQPREWSICRGCGQTIWRYGTMFAAWRTNLFLIEEEPW